MLGLTSLRAKTFAYTATLVTLAAGILTVLIVNTAADIIRDEFDKRGFTEAFALSSESRYPLLIENKRLLREISDRFLAKPDLVAVDVFNSNLRNLLAADRGDAVDPPSHHELTSPGLVRLKEVIGGRHFYTVRVSATARAANSQNDDYFFLDDDLPSAEAPVGYVRVGLSANHLEGLISEVRTFAMILFFLVVAVSSSISFTIIRRIIRPLTVMADRTQAITADNLASIQPIIGRSHDEIGRLVRAFNRMVDELQQRDTEVAIRSRELVDARKKAEDANRAKTDFLNNVTHELRTPLNVIIGFSGLLESGRPGELNETQKKFVNNVNVNGELLLSLVNDLLDLSKAEAGKEVLKLSLVDLVAASAELHEGFMPQLKQKNLRLEIVTPTELVCLIDRQKLTQILFNLVSNAIKFSNEAGVIKITLTAVDSSELFAVNRSIATRLAAPKPRDGVLISVEDHGIGIAPENHSIIFEKFEQIKYAGGGHQSGTGLGLSLTRELVEIHGGCLWLERAALGVGAVFMLWLPDGSLNTSAEIQA